VDDVTTGVAHARRLFEPRVALKISLVAQRSEETADRKARFTCDGRALIVEDLVLRRWRQRRRADETFHGCRLPPRTWDVARECLANGFCLGPEDDVDGFQRQAAKVRSEHPLWKHPSATHFLVILRFLNERGVLQQVLDHSREFASPGLPDLVLYRRRGHGQHYGFIFVEVKRTVGRWREPLSPAQRAELQFLRSLGLKAGVVRVIERA
jgi:hypothetical protein